MILYKNKIIEVLPQNDYLSEVLLVKILFLNNSKCFLLIFLPPLFDHFELPQFLEALLLGQDSQEEMGYLLIVFFLYSEKAQY